ncbi:MULTISPECIES: hypothetical protein [Streptomyces]
MAGVAVALVALVALVLGDVVAIVLGGVLGGIVSVVVGMAYPSSVAAVAAYIARSSRGR